MSPMLWISAVEGPKQPSRNALTAGGSSGPSDMQGQLLQLMKGRTQNSPRMDAVFDPATNGLIKLWTPEDVKKIHGRIERIVNLHMDVLKAVKAEKLTQERFRLIRWIVRGYAVLGDKENTARWASEAKKTLKFTTDKYVVFRDSDEDNVHAWDLITQDPTRHPEWNAVEKKYQSQK